MPCSDNGWSEYLQEREIAKRASSGECINNAIKLIQNIQKLSAELITEVLALECMEKRNTLLAQFLCYTLNSIDDTQREILLAHNWSLQDWWEEHDKSQ